MLNAHAKINLALSVGPPAGDGYHPIASWLACVDLADTIAIEPVGPRGDTSYARAAEGPPGVRVDIDWPLDHDLAVHAHRALEQAVGRTLPARIEITKRIPPGGGLGGGSSDAAAVLCGLNRAFGLGLPANRLAAIGATIGSDVPFFIDDPAGAHPPRPAVITGRGELVERVEPVWTTAAERDLILVFPPFGCSTGEVYRAYDAAPRALREDDVRRLAQHRPMDPAGCFNDLAEPACRVRPRLASLREEISLATGRPVHVSGSGSTLFLFGSTSAFAAARDAAERCLVAAVSLV